MTDEGNSLVSLDQLAVEIRFYSNQTAQNIIEVGKRLIEAKKQVAHGEWGKWLEVKVNFSQQTAIKFMNCAERYSNLSTSINLNLSQMTELLLLSSEDADEFVKEKQAEGNPVEDMTIKTLRQEIKNWKSRAEDAEQKTEQAKQDYQEQQESLKETIRNQADEIEQAKERAATLEDSCEALKTENDDLRNRKPEVKEVSVIPSDYEENKRKISDLQFQLGCKQDNIDKMRRELETLKAHNQGLTLHEATEKAEREGNLSKEFEALRKTENEERAAAKLVSDLMVQILQLPSSDIEMRELARCLKKRDAFTAKFMPERITECIQKLTALSECLTEKATLKVVK